MHLRPTLALALTLVACAPASAPTPSATPTAAPAIAQPTSTATRPAPTFAPSATPEPDNILGVHLLLDDGRNVWPQSVWAAHLQAARAQLGAGGYVVELVRLDDLDVARWQVLLDLCAQLELRPIVRLATTYDRDAGYWTRPPGDPDGGYAQTAGRYARFVAGLKWPTDTHPVLVGNEPNHGDEWGGVADPAAYARFLRDVARAVHAADPQALVLNAPLDAYAPHTNGLPFNNGFTYVDAESFMDGMRAEVPDVFDAIDAWAAHPYPTGPLANGPWDQVFQIDRINGAANPDSLEPEPGQFNRGINGYIWELAKLESYGVRDLDVWITETGWRHAESQDPAATDGGRDWPAARVVGQWLDLALNGNAGRYPEWPTEGWLPWRHDPRVRAVVLFAFDGAPHEWGHTNWLKLDSDGVILGTYPLVTTPRAP